MRRRVGENDPRFPDSPVPRLSDSLSWIVIFPEWPKTNNTTSSCTDQRQARTFCRPQRLNFQNGCITKPHVTMATLTIKNLPNQLYERLRTQAKRHRRSINSEAIVCLEQVLVSRRTDPEADLEKIRRLRQEMVDLYVTDADLQAAKNEGRP